MSKAGKTKDGRNVAWIIEIDVGGGYTPYSVEGSRRLAEEAAGRLTWPARVVKYVPEPRIRPSRAKQKAPDVQPTESTLTDWIPCSTPPERVGVYDRDHQDGLGRVFQHWNGRFWGSYERSAPDAHKYRDDPSEYQSGLWRGYTTRQE